MTRRLMLEAASALAALALAALPGLAAAAEPTVDIGPADEMDTSTASPP